MTAILGSIVAASQSTSSPLMRVQVGATAEQAIMVTWYEEADWRQ
jgi:hypothetical protein